MGLTLFWTQFAEDRLRGVFDYYKVNASVDVALGIVAGIYEATNVLKDHPFIGKQEQLKIDSAVVYRYVIHKNYKIVYLINDLTDQVIILNVFDCRRNPKSLLLEL
ncbi:MAG: type II toxin-antitoxin system RelE/ParE family toxin [Bacteroidia bacterium]